MSRQQNNNQQTLNNIVIMQFISCQQQYNGKYKNENGTYEGKIPNDSREQYYNFSTQVQANFATNMIYNW